MSTPRERLSAITHADRPFHDPLDPAVVDEVLDFAGVGPGDRALDLGCGPGELLVRLAERTGCGGLGVDLAAAQIEEARRRAAARAPQAQLEFARGSAPRATGSRRRAAAARWASPSCSCADPEAPSSGGGAAQRVDVAHQPILGHRRRVRPTCRTSRP